MFPQNPQENGLYQLDDCQSEGYLPHVTDGKPKAYRKLNDLNVRAGTKHRPT